MRLDIKSDGDQRRHLNEYKCKKKKKINRDYNQQLIIDRH